jgi:sugar diacid utilization regulator
VTQKAPVLEPTPAQAKDFARRIYAAVRQEVPAYRDMPADLEEDFAEINRLHVETYFRSLRERRLPDAREQREIAEVSRRRVHQAVPFEAIYQCYQVGVRVLWSCLREIADGQDLGELGALTLDYADAVSSTAAQAYLRERGRVAHSHDVAARFFFTRLMHGELQTDEEGTLREARALGYDLSQTHIAAVVSRSSRNCTATAEQDLALARAADWIGRYFTDSPTISSAAGLLIAVPGDSVPQLESILQSALRDDPEARHHFTVGIGTPRAGAGGLVLSWQEAQRAQALGMILSPEGVIHRYDQLRLFDLFKTGETVDAYVNEVLGKLISYEKRHQSRLSETLEALFGAALNRKLAARRLRVHPNTISYRIQRIEQILGGSLLSGEFCFRVQLALRLLPLSSVGVLALPADPSSDAAMTSVADIE